MKLVYPFVDKEPNMVLIGGMPWRKSEDDRGKTADRI